MEIGTANLTGEIYLVTGGARSGKSAFAETLAAALAAERGGSVAYIATADNSDDEMDARIREHRGRRPADWKTIEAPVGLVEAIGKLRAAAAPQGAALVDCVTVWISNLLLTPETSGREPWGMPDAEEAVLRKAEALVRSLKEAPFPVVLVTNEVGHSLVPEYALGRLFRDVAGKVNQLLAANAVEVFYVVCGVPLHLRQLAWRPKGESGEA